MSKPRYIKTEEIKERLLGKITLNGESPYALSDALFDDYIALAETEVENDFSPFYLIPIQGIQGEPFDSIPKHYQASKDYFRAAFIAKACFNVLNQEFARFNNVQAEVAIKHYQILYDNIKRNLTAKTSTGRYINPPKPGIATNSASFIMATSLPGPQAVRIGDDVDSLSYANKHITNPARTWYFRP